jgi:hypothetical protein
MQRLTTATPVAQGLLLDAAAHVVQGCVGEAYSVEGADSRCGRKQRFGAAGVASPLRHSVDVNGVAVGKRIHKLAIRYGQAPILEEHVGSGPR